MRKKINQRKDKSHYNSTKTLLRTQKESHHGHPTDFTTRPISSKLIRQHMTMSSKIVVTSRNQLVKVIFLLSIRCLYKIKIKKKQSNTVIKRVSMKGQGKLRRLRKLLRIITNKNPLLHLIKILKLLMLLTSPETFTHRLEITTVGFCITKDHLKMISFFLKLIPT